MKKMRFKNKNGADLRELAINKRKKEKQFRERCLKQEFHLDKAIGNI